MTKPIRPQEAAAMKASMIPDFVIESANRLIAQKLDNGTSTFTLNELVEEILRINPATTRDELINKKWFDIEDAYRIEGWEVHFHRPRIDESFFVFTTVP